MGGPGQRARGRHQTRPPERALLPALLLLAAAGAACSPAAEEPQVGVLVHARHASFRGLLLAPATEEAAGVAAFLGIRYASAPIRRLRFMPPTAYHYANNQEHRVQQPGPICRQRWPVEAPGPAAAPAEGQQAPEAAATAAAAESEQLRLSRRVLARASYAHLRHQLRRLAGSEQSEDCLYLNVYAPLEAINRVAGRQRNSSDNNNRQLASQQANQQQQQQQQSASSLPVLVIIQADSLDLGASSLLEPQRFIQRHPSQLVVTLNYRLGLLGFPPKMAAVSRGNLGLMDQVAALHWIKDNIGAFGGAPDQVTLMGSRRAAIFVNLLMLSPLAKGLFQRAVMEDGSALTPLLATGPAVEQQQQQQQQLFQLAGSQAGAQLHLRLLARLCDCPPGERLAANGTGELLRQQALALECLRQRPVEQLTQRVPLSLLELAPNQTGRVQLQARWRAKVAELHLDYLADPSQPITSQQLARLIAHVTRLELAAMEANSSSQPGDLFAAIHDPATSNAHFGPTTDGVLVPADEDLASLMLRPASPFGQRDLLLGSSRPGPTLNVDQDDPPPAGAAPFRLRPEHPMAEQLGERLERLGADEQQALELLNGFVRAAYRFHNQEIANSIIQHYLSAAGRARRLASAEQARQLLAALLEAFEDALVGVPLLRTALIHASRQLEALAEAFVGQQLGRAPAEAPETERLLEPFAQFALGLLAEPGWPLELLGDQEPAAKQPRATYLYQLDGERLVGRLERQLARLNNQLVGQPEQVASDELYQTASGRLVRPSGRLLGQLRDQLAGLLVELQSAPVPLHQLHLGCAFQPPATSQPPSPAESLVERVCLRTSVYLARFVATGNVNRWPENARPPAREPAPLGDLLLGYEERCSAPKVEPAAELDWECRQQLSQLALDYLEQSDRQPAGSWPVFNLFSQPVARLAGGLGRELQVGAIADDSHRRSGFMARAWFWANFVPALNCGRTQPVLPVALANQQRAGWWQPAGAQNSSQVSLGLNLVFGCSQPAPAGSLRTGRDVLESVALAMRHQLSQRLRQLTSGPPTSENHLSLRNASNMSSTLLQLEHQQQDPSSQLQDQQQQQQPANRTGLGAPDWPAGHLRARYALAALALSGLSLAGALACLVLRGRRAKTARAAKLNGRPAEPPVASDPIKPPEQVATLSPANSLAVAQQQQAADDNHEQQAFYWNSSLLAPKSHLAGPPDAYGDEREPIMMPILHQDSPIEQQRRGCLSSNGYQANAGSSSDTQNQSSASSQRQPAAKKRVKISDPSLQHFSATLARPSQCRQHQQLAQLDSYCPVHQNQLQQQQQQFYTLRAHHQHQHLEPSGWHDGLRASTFGHLLPHQQQQHSQQLLLAEPTGSLLASNLEPALHHEFAAETGEVNYRLAHNY